MNDANETDILKKSFSTDVKANEGERAVTAKITTATVDREGDVIQAMGMYSKDFEKNPVVFLGHNYTDPNETTKGKLPIGKVVAMKRADDSVTAKIVFAERPPTLPAEQEWLPDTVLSLFQQKVLNAFSIGFNILEQLAANTRDRNVHGEGAKRLISKWELIELSVAPIPMNGGAVAVAVSKGLLSRDSAKSMFGWEDDGTLEAVDSKPEKINNDLTILTPAKHVKYVIEPPSSYLEKTIGEAVAKARGRIYYV